MTIMQSLGTFSNLDEFIKKIKEEVIDSAQREADRIILEAKVQGESLIKDALNEAQSIMDRAEDEIAQKKQLLKTTLEHVARDAVIELKNTLSTAVSILIKEDYRQTVSNKETLFVLLTKVIDNWQIHLNEPLDLEVIFNETNREQLLQFYKAKLTGLLKAGGGNIEFVGNKDIKAGFFIKPKGSDFYYDFTDEGVSEVLMAYINPRLLKYLDLEVFKTGGQINGAKGSEL